MEEKKTKNSPILVVAVILLTIAVVVLLAALLYKNPISSNEEPKESKIELTEEKLNELVENSYTYDIKGNDIVEYGLTDETRLSLVANYIEKANNEVLKDCEDEDCDSKLVYKSNSIEIKTLANKSSNIIEMQDEEGDPYYGIKNAPEYRFNEEEAEYYSYEMINKIHKELFNADAKKINFDDAITFGYIYDESINGYIKVIGGVGAVFVPMPIHGIKDYKVEDNKLTINLYHAAYDYKLGDDTIDITMRKNKSIKYSHTQEIAFKKDVYNLMLEDMKKNHLKDLDIVKFIYTIDGDNYYLTSIQK